MPSKFDASMQGHHGPSPSGLNLSYRSQAPSEAFRSARSSAQAWAEGLDTTRIPSVRDFVRQAVQAYAATLASRGDISDGPSHPFEDLEFATVSGHPADIATAIGTAAGDFDQMSAAYWIGATYASLLPGAVRSKLGAYYTPPTLSARLLDLAGKAGTNWKTCRALDPACGGGAFLGPIASRMVESMRDRPWDEVVANIAGRLRGFEIDPFAAWLSQAFLELHLAKWSGNSKTRLPRLVEVCDSLERKPTAGSFDLVVGNPPYGRVRLRPELRERFQRSLYGHANLYGVFTDLALRWTAPGGLVAFVTPTSFLAGQYFKSLRELLATKAPPVAVDVVEARQGVFEDVLQETMLSVFRSQGSPIEANVRQISVRGSGTAEIRAVGTFKLPKDASSPWILPRRTDQAQLIARLAKLPSRLADWGYRVSTGPLVWNRHKSQLRRTAGPGCAPLVWAESIAGPGRFVFRAKKKHHEPYFELRRGDDWLCIDEPCVLLQRTTAKEQGRRLVAATLPSSLIDEFGSVVIENHLNMVRPLNGRPKVSPSVIAAVFNSEVVDSAFRCISGSVAVSAFELEALPLPSADGIDELVDLVAQHSPAESIERCLRGLYFGAAA